MFTRLLTSIVNACNRTKCVSLNNQQCITQPPTLNNLHPNEYTQGLCYYPFAVNLERCVRICNTLNDLSNRVSVPNKTEDLNVSAFNMITGLNESKIITKKAERTSYVQKDYIWNLATCSCENGKYLGSIKVLLAIWWLCVMKL